MQAGRQVTLRRQDNTYVTVSDAAAHDQGKDLSLAVRVLRHTAGGTCWWLTGRWPSRCHNQALSVLFTRSSPLIMDE